MEEKKKPFKSEPITEGPFKGKTLIMETEPQNVTVVCKKCGWSTWQTFFIEDFSDKDIGRECEKCGSELTIDRTKH